MLRDAVQLIRSPIPGLANALTLWLVALGFVSGMSPSPAVALDPQRPLSQALLRIWQVQQGLPRAAIFSIRQTRNGYLWLGTQDGLYRFDGVRFTAVTGGTGGSLGKVWIQDLCEDHAGNLWIATDGAGLIRLQGRTASYIGRQDGLPSQQVRCLLMDRRGSLWVGTDQGLVCITGDRSVVYRTADGLPGHEVRALSEGPGGQVWIACADQPLCHWDGKSFVKDTSVLSPVRGQINALQVAGDGTIWIGTTAGLMRRSAAHEKTLKRADGLAHETVYCLTQCRDGSLCVGTKDGFSRIQGDHIESFRTRDGLSQSTVYTLCEDHEGSLWVGTKHGLNQFADRRTLPFTASEGLPSNDTGPILQDAAGQIWVGTLGAGLAKFDGRRFSVAASVDQGLPSNSVLALADGNAGELWVGTDQGLSRLRDGLVVDRFTTEEGLPSNIVTCLSRDQEGVLWVGTKAGIAEFRDSRFVAPGGEPDLVRRPVQALIERRSAGLLVATSGGGLYRVQHHQIVPVAVGLPTSQEVDAFYLDPAGLLWLALRGRGLALIDGEKLTQFTVKDGLYDDDIFGAVEDDAGRLWMACSRGIFSVTRTELLQFAAGQLNRVTSFPFSPTDALRTIECRDGVQPAIWKMRDGCVWFSTIRGIIVIDPKRLQRKLPPPSILIEEVRVDGQSESARQLGRLPPGRTNFEFHYTALSFASPSRIRFLYLLEGFDKDWIDAGPRREAFYTNLPPGSYRFRVKAVNADGEDYEAQQPVEFTLDPSFYQTRWFIPAVVVGALCLGWLLFRLRIRQIKSQLQAVLAERSRIARELHDTLIQGFSGVTMQMQALASRLRQSPEREVLTDIIHDAGDCLREARRSVAGLRNPQEDESGLASSIAQAARQLTETRDLRLRLKLSSNPVKLGPDVEYNVLRIVQEAISNAARHAGATVVEVTMTVSPQQLTIIVHDDGSGFDVERYTEHVQPGHYGVIGMRERAAQIHADLVWHSESRQGTTVTLTRLMDQKPGSADSSPPPSSRAQDVPTVETAS